MATKSPNSPIFVPALMRAISASRFGPPREVLALDARRPVPPPAADRVQIRVHSAAVHAGDWRIVRGEPFFIRLMFGRVAVPGCELSGVVTAVGKGVSRFRPGDRVLADASEGGFGAFAEYVSVPEPHVASIPPRVTFRNASATVTSALAALQAVKKVGGLTKDDRVLVTGASGGVGHFVVQMAHQVGAHVTAVCRSSKAAAVRKLGADHTLDTDELKKASAVKAPSDDVKPYTAVIDTACYSPPCDVIANMLPRSGRYVMVGGSTALLLRTAVLSGVMKWRLGVNIKVLASQPNGDELNQLAGMLERDEIAPRIDRVFRLEETVDAIEYIESRKVTGKVVIDVQPEQNIGTGQ